MYKKIIALTLLLVTVFACKVGAVDSYVLRILSPNGGENLVVGQTFPITWVQSPNVTNVTIGYSGNGGMFGTIASHIGASGFYNWVVDIGNSAMIAGQAKLWIAGYQDSMPNPVVFDTSDNSFTISRSPQPLSISVLSPNGGETLTVGQTFPIRWSYSSNIDKVTIGYSSAPGSLDWIANNIPNTGTYNWTVNVGNTTNTQFKIYIIGYQTGSGSISDYSDNYFTVRKPVQLPTATPTPICLPCPKGMICSDVCYQNGLK